MRARHVFSVLMLTMGVALLVAAATVGAASSATGRGSAGTLRGGTLRVDQAGAFDTLDPGLASAANDWQVLYSTELLLLNYPNKAGQAGGVLFPEAAKAFPTISRNGKVVTFHLRSGLRFDDGTRVAAADYRRAWERILSPHMFAQIGLYDGLDKTVVGGQRFAAGKAAHISGIEAHGLTLVFHLTKPSPEFLSTLALPWFGAVKPGLPYTRNPAGILTYAAAGPYYIAQNRPHRLVVLKRNRYYRGARPANPDEIVIRSYPSSNGEASLQRVERNQVDYDLSGVPPADVQAVAEKYGYPSNKHSRFHVATGTCFVWEVLNTTRPPTNDVRVRRALNYALGRAQLVSLVGPYAGTPTDQILVPGVPGYEKLDLYPSSPDVAKAEQVGGAALQNAAPLAIYYDANSPYQTAQAQLEQSEIQAIGLTVNLVKADPTNYYGALETKGGAVWNLAQDVACPDRPDAFDYVNAEFGSGTFPDFRNASFARKSARAATLTGKARAQAYARSTGC